MPSFYYFWLEFSRFRMRLISHLPRVYSRLQRHERKYPSLLTSEHGQVAQLHHEVTCQPQSKYPDPNNQSWIRQRRKSALSWIDSSVSAQLQTYGYPVLAAWRYHMETIQETCSANSWPWQASQSVYVYGQYYSDPAWRRRSWSSVLPQIAWCWSVQRLDVVYDVWIWSSWKAGSAIRLTSSK